MEFGEDGTTSSRGLRSKLSIGLIVTTMLASLVAVALPAGAQEPVGTQEPGSPPTTIGEDQVPSDEVPDGFGDPETQPPPPGTPFDDFDTPSVEPLKPPEAWEIDQARELRAGLGFTTDKLDSLFAASTEDPDSAEALSRNSTGTPMTVDEFGEFERRMSMGDAQAELVLKAQGIIGFAGNYIDQAADGSQVLLFTEEAKQGDIASVVDGYEHERYLIVRTVERSTFDLAIARDGAYKAMEATEFIEGSQWALYTDYEQNSVVLEYVQEAEKEATQIAEQYGIQATLFEGYLDEVDCNDTNCFPLAGGTNTGGGTGGCTWGYVLISTAGNLRISTAGHCADAAGDATRTWNGMTLNRISWQDAGAVDFAVYEIPIDEWATNDTYRSDSGLNRFGLQVGGHRNPQQWETVCKRGRTTNWTCGQVTTAAVGELARANYRSCPGDSGAPVSVWASSSRRTAVGTHTNGPFNPGCPSPIAGTRRFMIDQYISSTFFHTVYTHTNVRRDFAISLYDRALDRAPDQGGLIYWQSGLCNITGLGGMATAFFTGAEFKNLPAVNDINSASELRQRFYRLYRGVLRRSGTYGEAQGWANWVYNNAPSFPGANTTQKRENAYNSVAAYFGDSPEFHGRFNTNGGGDGEIPLCSN